MRSLLSFLLWFTAGLACTGLLVSGLTKWKTPVSAEVAEMDTWPGTRSLPGLILMRAVCAASRAKMSEVRQALRNSSVGMMVRVV